MAIRIESAMECANRNARDAFGALCSEFLSAMMTLPKIAALDASMDVYVVIDGDEAADHWGIDGDAVGYFAVISPRRTDESGQWYDVNERLEVHLNLDVALPLLAGSDRSEIEIELEAWLTTIPHELLHVADWVAVTRGKTPVEVFDEGEGELAVKAVFDNIVASAQGGWEDIEDRIEGEAREIVYAALLRRPLSDKVIDSVVASLPQTDPYGPSSPRMTGSLTSSKLSGGAASVP